MTFALFPIGLIGVYQTSQVIRESEELRRAALLLETTEEAREARDLIQQGLGAAEALAALNTLDDDAACSAQMRSFVETETDAIFAAFVRTNGMMSCASRGQNVDFSSSDGFQRAMAADGPIITVRQSGAVTGQPVLLITHPVQRDDARIGFVTLSFPLRVAENAVRISAENALTGFKLAILTESGELIATSSEGMFSDMLPQTQDPMTLASQNGMTFVDQNSQGDARMFAVVSMMDKRIVLVGSWPKQVAAQTIPVSQRAAAIAFPALIWLAGLAVAFFGLRHLVIGHAQNLRSAMRRFALGDKDAFPLVLKNAPEELAETERAFNRMALLISEAEERQAQDLKDKEVLLKEVHHRVKNNLQLIASIMNMQSRAAESEETKSTLSSLQRRVNSLAMLHRTLYTAPDTSTVDTAELIEAVVRDVSLLLPDGVRAIDSDIDSVLLYPDQAVPLSMILAEALTNAVKYAGGADGMDPKIAVSLKKERTETVRVIVENSRGAKTANLSTLDAATGLGTRLMAAFVEQLDATYTVEESADSYTLTLTFQQKDFEPEAA
ncbi:MAG: histidine kinase dimerization/phosphoacceptor domain -containing protein [Pseudomonadota bacterium]